jgi:hypothetical protein
MSDRDPQSRAIRAEALLQDETFVDTLALLFWYVPLLQAIALRKRTRSMPLPGR